MILPTYKLQSVVKSRQEVLEDFEGPLDLILEFLRRDKIEIQDLRISTLLEQYLAWIDEQRGMDLEVASEFVAMASHLVYLKTRMLLSIDDKANEEVDELMLALRERLKAEEYQKILVARAFFEQNVHIGSGYLSKTPEIFEKDKLYTLTHPVEDLTNAIKNIGIRALRKEPPPKEAFSKIISKQQFGVIDKISYIMKLLHEKGQMLLKNLFKSRERSEVIVSFLAVLEMCRDRRIKLTSDNGEYVLSVGEDDGNVT